MFPNFRKTLCEVEEKIPNFKSKRPYPLITNANFVGSRNIKIKSVLTPTHSYDCLLSLYFCKFQHKESLIYLLPWSLYLILLKVYRMYILFKDFALENIQTIIEIRIKITVN